MLCVFFATIAIIMIAMVLSFNNLSYHKYDSLVVADTLVDGTLILRSQKTGGLETKANIAEPPYKVGDTLDAYESDTDILGVHVVKVISRKSER